MKHSMLIFSLLSVLFITSCSEEPAPPPVEGELPNEYSYDLMISCYCTLTYVGPHKLRIKNNEVISYELKANDAEEDRTLIPQFRIEALTEQVEMILREDPEMSEVTYNDTYGFPEKAYFDVDFNIADEEWGFTISNFKVHN